MAEAKVRLSSTGQSSDGQSRSIVIDGLNDLEAERLEGCLRAGYGWSSRDEEGRLRWSPTLEPLPAVTDDELLPFWRRFDPKQPGLQETLLDLDPISPGDSASLTIQALCGYNYTPELYKQVAEALHSYGFECFRSQRRNNGRFSELWVLSSLFAAKGDLADALTTRHGRGGLEQAIKFFQRHWNRPVSFGTLDVSVQRMAMSMED